jgi:hypothetical protein
VASGRQIYSSFILSKKLLQLHLPGILHYVTRRSLLSVWRQNYGFTIKVNGAFTADTA